jgi:hypothetical protein
MEAQPLLHEESMHIGEVIHAAEVLVEIVGDDHEKVGPFRAVGRQREEQEKAKHYPPHGDDTP